MEGETFQSARAQNLKLILVVDFVLQSEGHYYCGQADPTSQLRQTISTLDSVYPSTVGEGNSKLQQGPSESTLPFWLEERFKVIKHI